VGPQVPEYRVDWRDGGLSVRPVDGERDGFLIEVPVPVSRALGPHRQDVQLWLELLDATFDEDEGWESLDAQLRWNAEGARLEREIDAWLRPDAVVALPRDPAVVHLRLMAEYGHALWDDGDDADLGDLPLTEDLVRDLDAWNTAWEMHARFENQPLPTSWEHEAHRLRDELQRQLGPGYEIRLHL
jgi:hypothetical protein